MQKPIMFGRFDIGVVTDEYGNITFNVIDPEGAVIGVGNLVQDFEDFARSGYNDKANGLKLAGFDVFIIPESMKLEYICSSCGNVVTVPNQLFSPDALIKSPSKDGVDTELVWGLILTCSVNCCDTPNYIPDEEKVKTVIERLGYKVK